MTLCLFDLSAEFWRVSLGGKDPIKGLEETIDRVKRVAREHERLIICLDSPASIRKDAVPSYKSNRLPTPDGAVDALQAVIARLGEAGLPMAQVDGYEADDVIATLSEQSWPEETVVFGAEKDLIPLLTLGHVRLIGRSGPIDRDYCLSHFGIEPEMMSEWLSLAGDPGDGIPGCPNVGAGRATTLLRHFGSIAALLAAPDADILTLKGIGQKSLDGLRAWDSAESLNMVVLRRELPIKLWEILP
jgi:DNA polymerase-1